MLFNTTVPSSAATGRTKLLFFVVLLLLGTGTTTPWSVFGGGTPEEEATAAASANSAAAAPPPLHPDGGAAAAAADGESAATAESEAGGDEGDLLTIEELRGLVDDIGEEDGRLVRIDADERAQSRQDDFEDGCAASLPAAFGVLLSHGADPNENTEAKALAAEYATFCLADNHHFREVLSEHEGDSIHEAIVALVGSLDRTASAMASHLIYIASIANADNHQAFIEHRAVEALGEVVKMHDHEGENEEPAVSAVQVMWASAALQNLAASYCETEDGQCDWQWDSDQDYVTLDPEASKVVSDGDEARRQVLADPDLVRALVDLACTGPVSGAESEENPYPTDGALTGRDDNHPNIVAWAAAGALESVSLDPEAAEAFEGHLECLCYLSMSPDWLEQAKGSGVLSHLRRGDPCHMNPEAADHVNCIDHWFTDNFGKHCNDYAGASPEDCETVDVTGQDKAKDACCHCSGGDRTDYGEEL